jgi:hypothetical protein
MSFESVDIYCYDSTPQQNPLVGVVVKALSQDGTQTFTMGTTDTTGHVGFMLPSSPPDGTVYQLRAYQFGTSFSLPQFITVLPDPLPPSVLNSFEMTGTIIQPPHANDIRLCVASGYFRDMTGAPQRGLQIHFIGRFDPLWVDGAAVLKERVIISSDRRGYAQVSLFRNAQYNVTIQGEEDVTRVITVPDQNNVNMADLIFPIVQEVVLDPPPPYTIAAGTSLTVGISVIATNGQDLGTGYGDVMYSTTDQGVVGFALNPRLRELTLQAGLPGTAQIVLKRSDRSVVHLPYAPIAGQPINITVTP